MRADCTGNLSRELFEAVSKPKVLNPTKPSDYFGPEFAREAGQIYSAPSVAATFSPISEGGCLARSWWYGRTTIFTCDQILTTSRSASPSFTRRKTPARRHSAHCRRRRERQRPLRRCLARQQQQPYVVALALRLQHLHLRTPTSSSRARSDRLRRWASLPAWRTFTSSGQVPVRSARCRRRSGIRARAPGHSSTAAWARCDAGHRRHRLTDRGETTRYASVREFFGGG